MYCPAEVSKAVNRPLAIAVKKLEFSEVGGDEYRAMVSFCCIEDHVQSLGLFSIVIHHRLNTDLVNDRIVSP